MADVVVNGLYLQALLGLDLSYGAVAAMAQGHVAVNNLMQPEVQGHMLEKQ
jgi:hypothetical protein